jgi:hypothetical protein
MKYLRMKMSDENNKTIKKVQPIKSYESYILQINDIITGALGYYYRNLKTNNSKNAVVNEIIEKCGTSLDNTTYCSNTKFNILIWKSRYDEE